ncbi:hypothetical protein L218DRAFT_826067, partial [Marasmius fiardii PR-910]
RDVVTVTADIGTIANQVNTLDSSVSAFPDKGGSLSAALGIHRAAAALGASLKKAATDTQTTSPFSENDGQNILGSVEAIEPTILHALQTIVDKKPAFDALPTGGISALVLKDLQNLNT